MHIPLQCPTCGASGSYDLEKISGRAIIYRKSDFRLPADFPASVVVQCQHCPAQFKVTKQALEQAIVDANVMGTTRGG
jgi:uncharacterized Zn finger protein